MKVLPPLRDRRDDIPNLVSHFLEKIGAVTEKGLLTVTPAAMEVLRRSPWPGGDGENHRDQPGDALEEDEEVRDGLDRQVK